MRITKNTAEMPGVVKQLEQLRTKNFKELTIENLDIGQARMVLQVEGPTSAVFVNVETKERNFGSKALKFEYYWISLSYLISDGEFIFFVIYYVFSIQGLIQSPVFYSVHLLDVINRFPPL